MVQIIPLGEHVMVQPHPDEMITKGGIILPEVAERRNHYGKVLDVGEEVKGLTVGDNVVWNKYDGTEVDVQGTKSFIIKRKGVIAKFRLTSEGNSPQN